MSQISPLTGTASSAPLTTQFSRATSKSVKKSRDGVLVRGEVAAVSDTVRANLTASALHNAGALVAVAEGLMKVAPNGGPIYAEILQAYAKGAAGAISRFE